MVLTPHVRFKVLICYPPVKCSGHTVLSVSATKENIEPSDQWSLCLKVSVTYKTQLDKLSWHKQSLFDLKSWGHTQHAVISLCPILSCTFFRSSHSNIVTSKCHSVGIPDLTSFRNAQLLQNTLCKFHHLWFLQWRQRSFSNSWVSKKSSCCGNRGL